MGTTIDDRVYSDMALVATCLWCRQSAPKLRSTLNLCLGFPVTPRLPGGVLGLDLSGFSIVSNISFNTHAPPPTICQITTGMQFFCAMCTPDSHYQEFSDAFHEILAVLTLSALTSPMVASISWASAHHCCWMKTNSSPSANPARDSQHEHAGEEGPKILTQKPGGVR